MNPTTNECPHCQLGTLGVYCTRVDREDEMRVRYLKCNRCGFKPEPQLIALDLAPIQSQRTVQMRRITQRRIF